MRVEPKKIRGVGAILVNNQGELLLQLRTIDAPKSAGLIGTFGGRSEPGEDPYQTLARELKEELELDISSNGRPPKYLTSFESKNCLGESNIIFLISHIDDTKLVLHEGEAIVKLRKLSEISKSLKWYGLNHITDNSLNGISGKNYDNKDQADNHS